MNCVYRCLLALILPIWLSCSNKSNSLAGPSETTNGTEVAIAGKALTIKSTAKQSLYIYEATYHPIYGSGFSDTLHLLPNQKTEYAFSDTGMYNLFLFNETDDSGAAITALHLKPDLNKVLSLKMSGLGSVSGSGDWANLGSAVYIPGSPFGNWFSASGKFQLQGIPAGNYTLRAEQIIRSFTIGIPSLDSAISITIQPQDTLNIHFN